jgi:adenylate cyclase
MNPDLELHYEHERRFFVDDLSIIEGADWTLITQAYVFASEGYAVRVRLKQYPDESGRLTHHSAFVGIKGPRLDRSRAEDEQPVNFSLASEIVRRSDKVVIKKRFSFAADGVPWEVDEFQGKNYGLAIAEVELAEDNDGGEDSAALPRMSLDSIPIPGWLGAEIINKPEYNNENLAAFPVSEWPDQRWKNHQ